MDFHLNAVMMSPASRQKDFVLCEIAFQSGLHRSIHNLDRSIKSRGGIRTIYS